MLDARFWIQDAGFWILDSGYWTMELPLLQRQRNPCSLMTTVRSFSPSGHTLERGDLSLLFCRSRLHNRHRSRTGSIE